jgi:[protein-PII] uridylyltransferase
METALQGPVDDQTLLSINDLDGLAAYLRDRRHMLGQRALQGAGGLELARAYSDLVDGVIRRILAIACTRAGRGADPTSVPIAIVATGGYGRRELCPHSDIDITFIPHREGDALVDRIIKEMFTLLMRVFIDANGLEVGYAYRLMEDCAHLDHQTTSGLLDARLIAGSDRLFIHFEHEFWSHFNPADFIFRKLEERLAQRRKAGSTPRVVEPNLKEGAGGFRDLQTAVWVTQARLNLPAARVRGERVWEVLAREAEVLPEEIERLAAAKEFLFRVRNALHVLTGAERDQLVVTRQEEVAEALGYSETSQPLAAQKMPASDTSARSIPPVERFMRDYYAHASALYRITEQVMRRTERSRLFLGIGLDCMNRQIVSANPSLESEDPIWMLWACELAQKYNLTFGEDLERVIPALLSTHPTTRTPAEAAEILTRILASPRGAYPTLQRMADLGILGWILPEVEQIMNLIPYDPSHDYTVGQHTLHVIRYLDSLREKEGPEEERDYRQIMAELPHPEQLYLAALLHDAGKITDERPHAEVGEELAKRVCARLRWDEQATANVCFLVRHHLLMAETSRLRDLNLDKTIRDFVAVVDDIERLNMLYLLTFADTSAVGAGVWTQVKAKFLRDLHRRAERVLTGDEPEEFDDAELQRARRRLLKELSVENLPTEEVSAHVESMPATYILNTSLSEIALHVGFVRRARQGEPVIFFRDERDSTFTEITICTPDDPQPGLLAKMAGVFYAADLDVHSAQVFTRVTPGTPERIAIDNFYVDFRGRRLTPGKRKEISDNLTAVLRGQTNVAELLQKRHKSPEIGGPVAHLNLRYDLSETYTVIEVSCAEQRGMLYRVSGALSALGWDIHSARVSLFRGRSVATFYVTGTRALSEAEARRALLALMPISP